MEAGLLEATLGVADVALAGLVKIMWDTIKEARTENARLAQEVHDHYVRRTEFIEAVNRLERSFERNTERIMNRLDDKQDKARG